MVSMRVPEPVKQVFDLFPLETYPRIPGALPELKNQQLYVYNVDENGIARDPGCLAAQTFLAIKKQPVTVAVGSLYMTSAETLPLLVIPGSSEKLVCGRGVVDAVVGKPLDDPKLNIYSSLLNDWLQRAWLATVCNPSESETLLQIYASPADRQQPWPVRQSIAKQTEFHVIKKAGYHAGEDLNLHTASMAITALDKLLDGQDYFQVGDLDNTLSVLDVLTFAYIWPIVGSFPNSPLAALVTPALSQHAHRVYVHVFSSEKA